MPTVKSGHKIRHKDRNDCDRFIISCDKKVIFDIVSCQISETTGINERKLAGQILVLCCGFCTVFSYCAFAR